jgi:filamentous hemagglutinin family protein
MNFIPNTLFTGLSVCLCSLLSVNPVAAQIAGDRSLSTVVDRNGNVYTITGGSIKGGNLFHSFSEFSVPLDFTAHFDNGVNIQNIIGRVTGDGASNINGLIRANGTANLILINPNGINFGQGAQLDIGGSFLTTTADAIVFDDGTVFSANLHSAGWSDQ